MRELDRIIERSLRGEEPSATELITLFAVADEGERRALFGAADELKRRFWGDRVTYVVNLNLNFTNVCGQHCGFCNFRRDDGAADAYRMTVDECLRYVELRLGHGITEVTIQGGLDAETPSEFYFTLVSELKRAFPALHLHAYSPEEIAYLGERTGLPAGRIIERLQAAGLGSMPGTAAEILVDEVRRRLCGEKVMSDEWCRIVETAHRLGVRTTSTMMYGHLETLAHRAEHFNRLLEVQRRTGGFTEFIQLPFVSARAPIALRRGLSGPARPEVLNTIAAARLFFRGELPHIQAIPWVKRGLDEAVASLHCGADDLGGTLIEEKISRASGADHGSCAPREELIERITGAGLRPAERTTLYRVAEDLAPDGLMH